MQCKSNQKILREIFHVLSVGIARSNWEINYSTLTRGFTEKKIVMGALILVLFPNELLLIHPRVTQKPPKNLWSIFETAKEDIFSNERSICFVTEMLTHIQKKLYIYQRKSPHTASLLNLFGINSNVFGCIFNQIFSVQPTQKFRWWDPGNALSWIKRTVGMKLLNKINLFLCLKLMLTQSCRP